MGGWSLNWAVELATETDPAKKGEQQNLWPPVTDWLVGGCWRKGRVLKEMEESETSLCVESGRE